MVGLLVGRVLGRVLGRVVGRVLGLAVGMMLGFADGTFVEGLAVGSVLGSADGTEEGAEGCSVGVLVGNRVGVELGAAEHEVLPGTEYLALTQVGTQLTVVMGSERTSSLGIPQNTSGTGPVRALFDMFNPLSTVRDPNEVGINPMNPAASKNNSDRFVIAPKDEGIVWENLFLLKSRYVSRVRFPIVSGIGLMSLLLLIEKTIRLCRFPIVEGITLTREFPSRLSAVRDLRFENEDGMDEVSLLRDRPNLTRFDSADRVVGMNPTSLL